MLLQHISFLSFRCKVCHSTLLPESYTQGSDAGFLICTHHITDSISTHVDLNQQIESTENRPKSTFQAGYISLGGLSITSVPHYNEKTESQDRLVCKTPEAEGKESQEMSREVKDQRAVEGAGKVGPAPIAGDSKIQQEATKTQQASELSSPCAQAKGGSNRPVPAPRRMMDTPAVAVPAPRTRTSQTINSSQAAG